MKHTLAVRVKALRDEYKLSQDQFGSLIGVTNMAINRIESGKTENPQMSTLKKIAATFGTTVEWLLHGKGTMLPNGKVETPSPKGGDADPPWKDEAYQVVKSQMEKKDEQLDRLTQFLSTLQLNFLQPVRETA